MAFALGAAAFVVALLVSVMLHEAGHLVTARRFGMKAAEYFVGFGPTLWSRRRGETEYGVKAIPLGGYVRIVGYTPLEDVPEADRDRAFYRQPAGRRAVVIGAGVVVNLVFAFVLLVLMATALGVPRPGTATTTIARVAPCVPGTCGEGAAPSPARAAGLRPGDRVVAFGGRPVRDWAELRAAIDAARPGRDVPVEIDRDGVRSTVRVRPADLGGEPFLGVTSRVTGAGYDRLGPVDAAVFAGRAMGRTIAGIGGAVADLPAAVPRLFSPDRAESPGGQVGSVVGATGISGQIFAGESSWRDKAVLYLSLVVSVNIFLGVLNVVPLLPLDGGHLAVLAYERVRARVARARGRPDPGPVNMAKLMPLTYLVVLLLVGFGTLLIVADLLNPLELP
ncbi:M50 family metallopeptidase [Actinomadura flavalba]|uniref:M50 family metallopeptidase n=1 Tax=Actinomadura flavalba TaxID=1120938 RepID=UPI00036A087A|nr:site-2 protease family protein [Actinomadura flavalba]